MMLRKFPHLLFLLTMLSTGFLSKAQKKGVAAIPKCATMPRLEQKLQAKAAMRNQFWKEQRVLSQLAAERSKLRLLGTEAIITIPVVFHIILPNPAVVTDAQIRAQLDTLNRSFFGNNGDTARIPLYFKDFLGKSTVQFCLAQRTPNGDETTGIVRKNTSKTSFAADDGMKHTNSGGSNSWNTNDYLNIWVCNLSDGVLGYATFPNDGTPADQGVVIDFRSLPGGSTRSYNAGKTLVHETGHYFNLFHIWGDDNGGCSGTDYVDDTPNQSDATTGCVTGIRTDNCTNAGNGIMYQNYMDYSYDECLVMFTKGQTTRMEAALALNRNSLLLSNGCQPVVRRAFDVEVKAINSPSQRLCQPDFSPVITIRNRGSQALTGVSLHTQIDNGPVTTTSWTGNLLSSATAEIALNTLTTTAGNHVLTVYSYNPNGNADEEKSNDTLRISFQYYPPVTAIQEGFEQSSFPPAGWDIVNPDTSFSWERVTGIGKTGTGSVKMNNADYSSIGQTDDLRLPQISIPTTVDSAFFSFQLAAAAYTDLSQTNHTWDTLEVLISVDCGKTFTSLYKKWGASLVTRKEAVTGSFVPGAADWRKDSINLSAYIGQSNMLLAFRNTTGYENNIYLDDINLRTVSVNPNLKEKGFLVTPNPTAGQLTVQFYPQPAGLQGVQLFSVSGQKLAEYRVANGQANSLYSFDLSRYAAGTYYVRAVFADRVMVEKILKF